jgi:DNA-binding NarL/FixJ family response regulator
VDSKKINILMVDDHSIVRNGIRMMIDTTDDIRIANEAENAEEAQRLLHKGIFDVVLLDIGLPGMNGFDLLKILHVSHPDLPILMLSMYPEETYGSRALKFGASGYLSKNSSLETLTSAIRTVAGGGQHFSRNIAEKQASDISLIPG